jgi:hypothetical protein
MMFCYAAALVTVNATPNAGGKQIPAQSLELQRKIQKKSVNCIGILLHFPPGKGPGCIRSPVCFVNHLRIKLYR